MIKDTMYASIYRGLVIRYALCGWIRANNPEKYGYPVEEGRDFCLP